MKKVFLPLLFVFFMASGCGAEKSGANSAANAEPPAGNALASDANVFNPWINSKLPNTREHNAETMQMLQHMGAAELRIEKEAMHRKSWREEIYPVVFGNKDARGEIIAVLDFADRKSAQIWKDVMDASKSINSNDCKIVVFGKNTEPYGTDLTGLAIWIAYSRPNQAMQYLEYALNRWNDVKDSQKSQGTVKKFVNEYDATAKSSDYPIHYSYYSRLKPPVPSDQEMTVGRYCFDAGNVNMYQATQVCKYYNIKSLPAVVVNGRLLNKVSKTAILNALK